MCGIAGIYHYRDPERPVSRELLEKMNLQLNHRGPDEAGFFNAGNFGFTVNRLSIIDRKNGNQPISWEQDRYTIILNGEIYNYLQIKEELTKKRG